MTVVQEKRMAIDEGQITELIARGSQAQLTKVRVELVEMKRRVEQQLVEYTAQFREDRSALVREGYHPREAEMRASQEGDAEWRSRAVAFQRVCDKWISRINARIAELSPSTPPPMGAVVIHGAGASSKSTAEALNALLQRGAKIYAFGIVASDLVVVAAESR